MLKLSDRAYNASLLAGTIASSVLGVGIGVWLDQEAGWVFMLCMATGILVPVAVAVITRGNLVEVWHKAVGYAVAMAVIFAGVWAYQTAADWLPVAASLAALLGVCALAFLGIRALWRAGRQALISAQYARDKRRAHALLDAIEERREH